MIVAGLLTAALVQPCRAAAAQGTPIKSLGKPTAAFAEPFTHVAGVREQSDGRVVVLDDYDARIAHVDFRTGTATSLGRKGQGPGEYTLPQYLVALTADSTLAVDMAGGGRNIVITPAGVSGTPLRSAGNGAGKPLFMRSEIQSDSRGRIYELVTRIVMEGDRRMQSMSDGVRRLDRSTGHADTIGMVSRQMISSLEKPKPADNRTTTPAGPARAGGPPPPYSSITKWAVAPEGRIAVVSPSPYRVTFYEVNGSVMETPAIAYKPVRMTSALKEEWRKRMQRPALTIRGGPDGTMAGGTSKPRFTEPTEWPDELLPFIWNTIVAFAPDGLLWVERIGPAGSPQTFDVIDRAGTVASRVAMPPHTRLVGFGNRTVYAVLVDDDDLEHLQRFAMP